jgi:hypothetical protein
MSTWARIICTYDLVGMPISFSAVTDDKVLSNFNKLERVESASSSLWSWRSASDLKASNCKYSVNMKATTERKKEYRNNFNQ